MSEAPVKVLADVSWRTSLMTASGFGHPKAIVRRDLVAGIEIDRANTKNPQMPYLPRSVLLARKYAKPSVDRSTCQGPGAHGTRIAIKVPSHADW